MTTRFRNLIQIPTSPRHAFRHYFIPHEGNDYQPHVVRPKALKLYSALLIGLKLFIALFLYATYPNVAHFSTLTSETILRLTNSARAGNGEGTLTVNPQLTKAAKAKAENMLKRGYFDHSGPDGKKFWQWIKEVGYSYTTAGENLAMDFSTAESAHNALMDSPTHRANILRDTYREAGFGVAQGTMNGKQTTILVELFATPQPGTPMVASAVIAAQNPPATYGATLVGKSDERFILLPGSEVSVWLDFRNEGSAVWKNSGEQLVALNVNEPIGRESAFRHPSWLETFRPARLDNAEVRPGDIGRFTFMVRAPETVGDFQESFGLVTENLIWIDGANATLPITVLAPEATTVENPQELVRRAFTTTSVSVKTPDNDEALQPNEPSIPNVFSAAQSAPDWKTAIILWTTRIFWAMLIFISASLLLTVFVRIRVQHSRLIAQTLAVLVLAAGTTFLKVHFAERVQQPIVLANQVSAVSFSVTPNDNPVSVKRGTDMQFRADPTGAEVMWDAEETIGTITRDGVFTAKEKGRGSVTATKNGEAMAVNIRVVETESDAPTNATCTTIRSWVWVLLLFITFMVAVIATSFASERRIVRWVPLLVIAAGITALYLGTRCAGLHLWVPYAIGAFALVLAAFITRVLGRVS